MAEQSSEGVLAQLVDQAESCLKMDDPSGAWQIRRVCLVESGNAAYGQHEFDRLQSTMITAWRQEHGMGPKPRDRPIERMSLAFPKRIPAYLDRRDDLTVESLVVTNLGRFANSIIQIVNAVELANILDIGHVYLPEAWFLSAGTTKVHGISLVNDVVMHGKAPDSDEMQLCGSFFNRRNLFPLLPAGSSAAVIGSVADALRIEWGTPLSEDHLVVHIRSGDVFGAQPHTGYGQPPLAYYERLLESRAWSEISIVFENFANPVIEPFIHRCKESGVTTNVISGSLKEDLEYVLRARTLAFGRGTFGFVVAGLSRCLETMYCFDAVPVPLDRRPVRTLQVWDEVGEYRDAVLSDNWGNTPQQRNMMLSYPVTAVSSVTERRTRGTAA